MYNYITSTINI